MKRLITIVVLLLLIATSLIPGCTGRAYSYGNFVDDLRDAIVPTTIIMGESDIKIGLFSVLPQYIKFNGERINVLEYDNEAQADKEATWVRPDGAGMEKISETGETIQLLWSLAGYPHYYKRGRLIVLYTDFSNGSDLSTHNLLEGILGSQFAGQ